MSAQQMWEARTSGPKRAEAPSSGQAVGASENAQSETVHIEASRVSCRSYVGASSRLRAA